jgi:hypothetical protein
VNDVGRHRGDSRSSNVIRPTQGGLRAEIDEETSERWNPSSTPRIQFPTPRVPPNVPQTMVERNGSFDTVDDDSKVVGQLLLSLLTAASSSSSAVMMSPAPPPPPHALTRDEPLAPSKQATAANTVTATRTSGSDEPKDYEAKPKAKPDPPAQPHAEAAAASGGEQTKLGFHKKELYRPELFDTMFAKLGAMVFGFVVADVAGAFVLYAWADMLIVAYFAADTLLRMFQQRQQSSKSSSPKNATPVEPIAEKQI